MSRGIKKVADASSLFDILSSTKGGSFVTIGYITGAKLNLPSKKMRNPETNRMKSYDDYEELGRNLGQEGEIGGIVKFTKYIGLNFTTPKNFAAAYDKYKDDFNNIRRSFGIDDTVKRNSYVKTQDYGKNGIGVYAGDNDELNRHSYTRQNVANTRKIVSSFYAIDMAGNVIREIDRSEIKDIIPTSDVSGVSKLRAMGADDVKIKDYISQVNALNFRPHTFEASHILYICAAVNGEKYIWINENLAINPRDMKKNLNGVTVQPGFFTNLARTEYSKDLDSATINAPGPVNEQRMVRVTRNAIRNIVQECVSRIVESRSNEKKKWINRIYKAVRPITSKMYSDEYWDGVRQVEEAIASVIGEHGDLDVRVEGGGYNKRLGEFPNYKEYLLTITVDDVVIEGHLHCHTAGTMEDTFKYYDMSLVLY